jgi:photosystem II stability/assembly factor-like uncharacterized protein
VVAAGKSDPAGIGSLTRLEDRPLPRSPVARTQTESRFDIEAPPHRAMVLIAGLLVIAVVMTLVLTARMLRTSHDLPANNPPTGIPASNPPTGVPASNPPATAGSRVLPVLYRSFYSANDAAVQVLIRVATQSQAGLVELEITHDGGQSWIKTGIRAADINLTWLDPTHLIAAWDDILYPSGLLATSDGGYHWNVVRTGGPGPNTYFINASEGWTASCSECGQGTLSPQTTVSHTTDSGAHWQQLGKPFAWPGVSPLGLYFADALHGFMSADTSDGAGRLVATQDGGRTWRLVELPQPSGGWGAVARGAPPGCGAETCTLLPAMFGRQGVLLVEGAAAQSWLTYTTNDGGLTWGSPRTFPVEVPQSVAIPWQAPLDPKSWVTANAQGILYATSDGGSTWRQARPAIAAGYKLANVKPVGGGVLWGTAVIGSRPDMGFLVRSSDGGATWSVIKLPSS